MSVALVIVKAQLRPESEWPDWSVCCERMRECMRASSVQLCDVILGKDELTYVACPYCEHETFDVMVRPLAHPGKDGYCLLVDLYEFDEQVATLSRKEIGDGR